MYKLQRSSATILGLWLYLVPHTWTCLYLQRYAIAMHIYITLAVLLSFYKPSNRENELNLTGMNTFPRHWDHRQLSAAAVFRWHSGRHSAATSHRLIPLVVGILATFPPYSGIAVVGIPQYGCRTGQEAWSPRIFNHGWKYEFLHIINRRCTFHDASKIFRVSQTLFRIADRRRTFVWDLTCHRLQTRFRLTWSNF